MIKTEFSYSEQETKDFFRFHLTTKDSVRLIYYASSFLFVVAAGLFFFVFQKPSFGFLMIVLSIVLILLFPVQLNRTLNKQVQSRYKRNKQLIVFGEDKITQNIDGKDILYSWNQILEVNETRKYLYLYIGKASAIIVNKETLKEETFKDLIALIKKQNKMIVFYKNK